MRTNRKLLALTCIVLLTALGVVSFSMFGINEEVEALSIKYKICGLQSINASGMLVCTQEPYADQCCFNIWIVIPPG